MKEVERAINLICKKQTLTGKDYLDFNLLIRLMKMRGYKVGKKKLKHWIELGEIPLEDVKGALVLEAILNSPMVKSAGRYEIKLSLLCPSVFEDWTII